MPDISRLLAICCVVVLSACFAGDDKALAAGKELLRNGSFTESSSSGDFPAFWEGRGSPGLQWQRSEGSPSLVLTASAPGSVITASQEVNLRWPLPAAVAVRAVVKLQNVVRGEKSWHSGRILISYLDRQDKVLGETYTLDRLQGNSDWREVRRQFPVLADAVKVRLELQLLNAAQGTLALRQVSLRALDSEEAHAWRRDAAERIEKHRKASLRVRVVNAAGEPLPNAEIALFMRRHAYPFGTAVKADLLARPPDDPEIRNYHSVVEHFFNYATLENALKAPAVEKRGLADALAALGWLKERGIARRGHVLTWPSLEMSAKAVVAARNDPERLRAIMKDHFHDLLTATARCEIADWDVVNEPAVHKDLIRILGDQQVAEWFRWAAQDAPNARLYLNENNVEFQGGNREDLENWIRLLQEAKAPLGGIGWQGHMWHRTLPSGQNILDDLDHFAPYGLPVQITEYDTHERFTEQDEARFLDEFLTAWFSHPLTNGFIMWGFQDGYMWNGNGPLFRNDWSLKLSGKTWMDLVYGKWWTENTGRTDSKGEFATRAFLGVYELEIRHGARSLIRRLELGQGGLDLHLTFDQASTKPDQQPLASSNPYTTGKLPQLLMPRREESKLSTEIVSVKEGNGAAALVPKPVSVKETELSLAGHLSPILRRDLYLRFDLSRLSKGHIEKAALTVTLAAALENSARVNVYALSHRFVPQNDEGGLDWDASRMSIGYSPGRERDGDYRLGDAAVLYLGEKTLDKAPAGSKFTFSSSELGRIASALAGKGVTLILSPVETSITLAASQNPELDSPVLELQLSK